MENDRERPYSVLTRDEVKEKMKKQIDEISEIFCVSRSDATVLLMYLRWDSHRVSERLSEDKEKLLVESGLKFDSNLDLSDTGSNSSEGNCNTAFQYDVVGADDADLLDSACGVCLKAFDDLDLISTPICSHKFCTTCWSEHLSNSMNEDKTTITCPDKNCHAAAGPETIEKLPVWVRDIYERHILITYFEGRSKELKLCPAQRCNYATEFHDGYENDEEHTLNVVCLCGLTFCWKCKLESHRPVTCNNAADWLGKELKAFADSSTLSWIENNTKPCPICLCPVSLEGRFLSFVKYLTCACSARFCRKCLRLEEAHKEDTTPCVVVKLDRIEEVMDTSCLERWEACKVSMEEAKTDLKIFEARIEKNPGVMKGQDVKTVREGLMLILQCRQFLKWTCVYDHFHTGYEISKKEYLRFIHQNAAEAVQSYLKTWLEETERLWKEEIASEEELYNLRRRLSTATSDIGNYFYHFIKTLKDGLVDVKVMSYDGVGGPLWFCDRCTYGNKWTVKACKMCCDPTASPMEVEKIKDLKLD